MYIRSPFVAQAFVYGDSLQAHLVAIIVPDPDTLLPWAAGRGLPQDMARLVTDPTVTTAVFNSVLEEGRTSKLRGFEQVCCALACEEIIHSGSCSAEIVTALHDMTSVSIPPVLSSLLLFGKLELLLSLASSNLVKMFL